MMRLAPAVLCLALAGCAGAPHAPLADTPEIAKERRWPTRLETRLCPSPSAARPPYAACERIREPYVIEGRAPDPNVLAYRVTTDSGKTGYVEFLDYRTASEGEADRKDRQAKEAAATRAKAECDRRGGVRIGMTREQVYASCWGKPQSINTTRTARGDHEQLVYPGYNYLYLRDGILTSIQTSTR